ncbi:MAG: glutamyl-Q tRNA(Asp) synthetase [Paraglaciecola sp.]
MYRQFLDLFEIGSVNLPFSLPCKTSSQSYIGRFAPSPSGPLHLGSLVTAVGSYLRAKQHKGKWLVRIEDIDPPREQPGAAANILNTLKHHGLHWDEHVFYQSQQYHVYEQVLDELRCGKLTYYCRCTRKEWLAAGHIHCPCRELDLDAKGCSIRLKNDLPVLHMQDVARGDIDFAPQAASEDFVLKRKDGLYGYQLAVVLDDIRQGISEVVRGVDLLPATAYQLALYQTFFIAKPAYLHLPLVFGDDGNKLSKQNHAPALVNEQAQTNLRQALSFLGAVVPPSLVRAPPADLLQWAQDACKLDGISSQSAGFDNRIGTPDSI